MNDDGATEWLKWIAGGLIVVIGAIWQWMDRKIDKVNERIDTLRENVRSDRHELATKVQKDYEKIDTELKDQSNKITRLERNGGH